MTEKEILSKIKTFVTQIQENEPTGHDIFHVERVVSTAKKLALEENVSVFEVEILAWLHDVGDYKIHGGIDKTHELVTEILTECNFTKEQIELYLTEIKKISYKGGFQEPPTRKTTQIVQDADRLDALGAIGIARAFAYGGRKKRLIHHPQMNLSSSKSEEEYMQQNSPTIHHFYDKLLKLKDLMNTPTAKKWAEERHLFMLNYLDQFYKEWGNS